jgi:hypothetical protein
MDGHGPYGYMAPRLSQIGQAGPCYWHYKKTKRLGPQKVSRRKLQDLVKETVKGCCGTLVHPDKHPTSRLRWAICPAKCPAGITRTSAPSGMHHRTVGGIRIASQELIRDRCAVGSPGRLTLHRDDVWGRHSVILTTRPTIASGTSAKRPKSILTDPGPESCRINLVGRKQGK